MSIAVIVIITADALGRSRCTSNLMFAALPLVGVSVQLVAFGMVDAAYLKEHVAYFWIIQVVGDRTGIF